MRAAFRRELRGKIPEIVALIKKEINLFQVSLFFVFVCFALMSGACLLCAQPKSPDESAPAVVTSAVSPEAVAQESSNIQSVAAIETGPKPIISASGPKPAKEPVAEEIIPYVGAEKCRICHPQEYADQIKSKYSKTWKILQMRGEQDNPECFRCHATGAGKPKGFISAEKTPYLAGKQCEACHGPGGAHVKNSRDTVQRERLGTSTKEKNVCLECHLCMTTHRIIRF